MFKLSNVTILLRMVYFTFDVIDVIAYKYMYDYKIETVS